MKLEKFNEKKKQKKIIIGAIIGLILLIGGINLYRTFALYEEKKEFDVIKGRVPNFTVCEYSLGEIWDFDYNENADKYTFDTPCSGKYKIELWGAGYSQAHNGGGAYTSGIIYLKKDFSIYLYIGQKSNGCATYTQCTGLAYNGGGSSGYFHAPSINNYNRYYGGAGATDVRLKDGNWNNTASLSSRIMVAGGSGSCQDGICSAGGLEGYVASDYTNGGAGSQTSGGLTTSPATNGGFGYGGNGYISDPTHIYNNVGFGGGGGSYGGAGGLSATMDYPNNRNGSGGGGSSYISGHNGCIAIQGEDKTIPKNNCEDGTTDIQCSIHYSEFQFTDTIMIDGMGYKWSTEKMDYIGMPNYENGEIISGNYNDGHARITYVE